MTKAADTAYPEVRKALPLCRRYAVVRFASQRDLVEAEVRAAETQLVWGIGALNDGPPELLGAWLVTPTDGCTWPDVLVDLWSRGVERIDWVVAAGSSAPLPDSLKRGPKVGHWLDESLPAEQTAGISRRESRTVAAADAVARQLVAAMTRVARRSGGRFECADAAFACLDQQWQRLERRHAAESDVLALRAPVSLGPKVAKILEHIPLVRGH